MIYMDTDGDFANALGFSSPLSIPFALEQAVPQLAEAVEEADLIGARLPAPTDEPQAAAGARPRAARREP